ncbi:hypothetical protein ACKRZS_013191 [Fusarium odoratissimum]|uniref:SnoaL-like domain-containing protein n=3 Tax=Fusarium oxysporum species complex TaxID=171631 RepID=N1RBU8_FUSC4|nr:uncharacterized protein FOIG_09502 [Fusarium odoratissimum NRRL 54006]EMT63009.1 hypothetical protein FOC4_g10013204 [Fusarium odoratissimum]EXL98778.1 hypothetical protein FOIG_09502 [Fusarium odoratissimum NRRL 54006]KAK2129190.1 hypothetical protein NOF04DRAFT_6330 [Fusarium oxysporum II5]TXC01642.1 hypothetical protein FocTR4_00008003 [Fusarium oxysporum f. sp. cubense]
MASNDNTPSLEALLQRLQLLEDKDTLATLLNRYCNTADDHKWDEFADCFVPNGVLGFESWGDVVGVENIAAAARGAEDRFQGLQHSMSNLQFTVNGDTAEGRCYLWFSATMDTSKPHEYHAFGGHYRFKFQRTDKGWKISRMQLKKIWAQNEDTERVFG